MDYGQVRNFANQMYYYAREGDYRGVYSTREYYKAGKEVPFIASLILQDEFRRQICNCANNAREVYNSGNRDALKDCSNKNRAAIRNQFKFDKHDLVQESKTAFENKIAELYPKTAPMRQAIIDTGAVTMDRIVPKFKGIKKLLLKMLSKKYIRTVG